MKKDLKNRIPYFLLLAGIIIFFHTILPHDHHYAADNTPQTTHSHPDNSPVHCHTLNDLIIDFSKTGLTDQTIKILSESISIQNIFPPVKTENGFLIPFELESSYHNRLAFISISPTRGSPA